MDVHGRTWNEELWGNVPMSLAPVSTFKRAGTYSTHIWVLKSEDGRPLLQYAGKPTAILMRAHSVVGLDLPAPQIPACHQCNEWCMPCIIHCTVYGSHWSIRFLVVEDQPETKLW